MAIIVSMPFNGLLPFLLLQIQPNDSKGDESMPFIGLLPFLHKVSRLKAPEIRLSQCPLSGFFHFYLISKLFKNENEKGVNALYRASSISTLPSGNALK